MSLFGRKFDYRGERHVEPCSQYWSRDQKGGGQVDQTTRRYDGGGGGRERRGNLVSRAASSSSRGLLLPLARLLRSGDQSVVGVLVSCRGAENIHIKHHGSIIL